MLNEKLFDSAKSPVYLELLKIEEYPFHIHDEMEIIYLIKGELHIEVSVYGIKLTAGNSFVVNEDTMHYLKGMTGEDIALIVHIDINQFKEYYPNIDHCIFICNSENDGDSYYLHKEFQQCIIELAMLYLADKKNKLADIQNSCISILLILVNNFQNWHLEKKDVSSTNIYKDTVFQIQRLRRIVDYIYSNYPEKITLSDIAELEHVSKYYVSHLISTGLGTNFQDFLNGVRSEKSLEYLYGTKLNLEEVAEKCGFSSINFFRKTVIDKIGDTPSSLRKKHYNKSIVSMVPQILKYSNEDAKNILKGFVKSLGSPTLKRGKEVSRFSIDLSESPSKESFQFASHIHLSKANDIWEYGLIDQLEYLNESITVKYVSVFFSNLLEKYNKTDTWDFVNRFFYDLNKLSIHPEVLYEEKSKQLDSFVAHTKKLNGLPTKITCLKDNDSITLSKTPTEIINAVINGNYDVHIKLSDLVNKDCLKYPSFYAADFLKILQGAIIARGEDHLFTYEDNEYKFIILNDRPIIKDFILNLLNINQPMISRVFKINPETGNEVELWKNKTISRDLTENIKWSIENVCAPHTDLSYMKAMPEQDLFIPLEQDEAALIVLDV